MKPRKKCGENCECNGGFWKCHFPEPQEEWEKEFEEKYVWENGTYRHEPHILKDFIRTLLQKTREDEHN